MNKVAVIILNYKSWKETLEEARLCNERLGIPYEDIVIVDNASPNDSKQALEEVGNKKGFILLTSAENRGYAAGNNIGLRYAYENQYSYAWILNNDIIIEDSQIVSKMTAVFQKDSSVAIVNPDIYAPDGHMFNRDAARPTFWDLTLGALNYKKKGRNVVDLGGYAYIYRPQGCCMMVDLAKMNAVNYMDEHTFLYVEEPILAERLLAKGYRCTCCLNAQIIHNHSNTVKSALDKKKIRKIKNNSFFYYLKEYRKYHVIQAQICVLFDWIKWVILE